MKYLIALLSILITVSCSQIEVETSEQPAPPESSNKPENELKLGKKLTLWSTFYYIPSYKSDPNGIPLRDETGKILTRLPLKQNCNAQLQGSVRVDGTVYGFWTQSSAYRVDCSSISSVIPGTVKFRKETTNYGTGVHLWPLVPFKSIAVDKNFIPYGTTLYIPDLKGIEYELEGKKYIHDGIVIAQDTGGVIKGNHIDFFIGPNDGGWKDALIQIVNKYKFNRFIKSVDSGTFTAYVVD